VRELAESEMAVGKKSEKEAAEEEKGETSAVAAVKGGEKGLAVARKGEKGPTAVADKGKGVPEEAGKEVADEDMMMITLKSSDGKPFEVSKEVAARLSKFLADKIARGCSDDDGIELQSIGSEALEKVVDYCNRHDPSAAAASIIRGRSFYAAPSKDLEEWEDRKLVERLSQDALFDLVEAADFLKMDGLLDVTCRKIADMMKGKTTAQIRETFNIKSDFTEEQEEEIRQEHAWAFDD
jgi:S-phase kinase-associated protein 1